MVSVRKTFSTHVNICDKAFLNMPTHCPAYTSNPKFFATPGRAEYVMFFAKKCGAHSEHSQKFLLHKTSVRKNFPVCSFERCLDSNPEGCRSKQARYQLKNYF
jgi:hypothetical protein